jgi:hypothetical protein
MRRRALWISLAAALALGLPLSAYLGLRLGLATPLVNLALKKELGGFFNGEVRFGSFRSDLFSYAEINDLLVLTPHAGGKLPVLTAGRIRLSYDGWQWLSGRRGLEDAVRLLSIRSLRLFLLRDMGGRWSLRDALKLPGKKKAAPPGESRLPALATRLVLEDSMIVFNDERRNFQSTVENVEGTLDARAFPLVAFSLSGRTEGQKKDNLSFAGEWNSDEENLYARADLEDVPLKTYLNYALPAGGLQFLGGTAGLSVRVRQEAKEREPSFEGRADVREGSLAIPGIAEPLSAFNGEVLFGKDRLEVNGVRADFLGSTWQAKGELRGLRSPELDLYLENRAVALSPLSEQIKGLKALSLSGTASLALTMTGKAANPQASGMLSAPQMEIAGIQLSGVAAGIRLNKAGLQVAGLKGGLWKGSVQGSASLRFPAPAGAKGSIEAAFSAKGVDLAELRYRGVQYLPLHGLAALQAAVSGPLHRPRVKASLACPDAHFSGLAIGGLTMDALVEGKSLELGLDTWKGHLKAQVGFDFTNGAAFSPGSKISLPRFPVAELVQALADAPDTALTGPRLRAAMARQAGRLQSVADFGIELSGPLRQPELALRVARHEGHYKFPEGLAKTDDAQGLAFSLDGLVRLNPRGLEFGEGKLPFKAKIGRGRAAEFRLLGRLPLRADQDEDKAGLSLGLGADMGVLDELELFKKTRGSAKMDLLVKGRLDSLLVYGRLEVKDLASEMTRYLVKLKDGKARISVNEQSVAVENLSFESGGHFEAQGRLDFSSGMLPGGKIEAKTDELGLALENFNYGSLKAALLPLDLEFYGAEGMGISGKVLVHDSVIMLSKPKQGPARPEGSAASYPLNFDLRIQVDENVWLKKEQESVEISYDPIVMLKSVLNSTQETFQSPAFEFLFKPTDEDFEIRGKAPDLKVLGELGIARGSLTFLENEFKISQDNTANRVSFRGLNRVRADVDAEAVANIRYVAETAAGKPEPKTAKITVKIKPFSEDELERAHLENSLLNYNLQEFSSEPPLSANPEEERQAILSLLVLGDPLNSSDRQGLENQGQAFDASRVLSTQLSKVMSGGLRKFINRNAKFLGSKYLDYMRVTPRLRYQGGGGTSPPVAAGSQAKDVSQQIQQQGLSWSWIFELGRSVTKNIYSSLQYVIFGDDDVAAVKTQNSGPEILEVRNYGLRLGTEYRFTPTRVFTLSWGYSADENLEPVAFRPDYVGTKPWYEDQTKPWYAGVRNTIPTENYSPRLARQRRLELLEAKEAKP